MATMNFFKKLEEEMLLADGAMGTLLVARGYPAERLKCLASLDAPDDVREAHEDYIDAGAQIIETNTFDANAVKLMAADAEESLEAINRAAVRLARTAARGEYVFVAGSVGPLGAMVKPYGRLSVAEVRNFYLEQIRILVDEGVDLIVVETMSNILEAEQAVWAAREVSHDLPIIAQMTVLQDGHTKFGDEPGPALERLAAAGANIVGLNCTIGPQETYDLIAPIARENRFLISAQPNAGYPTLVAGRNLYLSSPEYLREYARAFAEAGVVIVGGCCGTTPEHIRAMAKEVRGVRPRSTASREPASRSAISPIAMASAETSRPAPEAPFSRLARKLARSLAAREETKEETKAQDIGIFPAPRPFTITCELMPPKGIDSSRTLEHARALQSAGVDAVEVTDTPSTRVRMAPMALAHLIQHDLGIETILQITCRDRNLLALQSDLLGAAALGIQAVMAMSGDPGVVGDYPRAASAFEVDAIGLIRVIGAFNSGRDALKNSIGEPTSLLVGALAHPGRKDLGKEIEQLEAKIEAGARYVKTGAVFDLGTLERFRRATEHLKIPLLVGLMPLKSLKQAKYLANEVPGMHLPAAILARLERAAGASSGEDAAAAEYAEGVALAREFFMAARQLADGVHFMPMDRIDAVCEILRNDAPAAVRP